MGRDGGSQWELVRGRDRGREGRSSWIWDTWSKEKELIDRVERNIYIYGSVPHAYTGYNRQGLNLK